ncbi:MAG: hypothetical protein ABFS21_12080 [Actinomycetota bacterium]
MYHQHDLVKAHVDAIAEELRDDRRARAITRGSPGFTRAAIVRVLVLTGARLHGRTPAVFGNRVVILDPRQDNDLRLAA